MLKEERQLWVEIFYARKTTLGILLSSFGVQWYHKYLPESPSLSIAFTSAPALTNNLMDSVFPESNEKKMLNPNKKFLDLIVTQTLKDDNIDWSHKCTLIACLQSLFYFQLGTDLKFIQCKHHPQRESIWIILYLAIPSYSFQIIHVYLSMCRVNSFSLN